MGMRAAEPENPILQAAPQEITVLQAGQGRGHAGNGETESQNANGSGGSKTDETQQGEQEQPDPEETENQTEQGQDTQPEQQPQGKPQQEVLAEAAIGTNTDSNQGDEGEDPPDAASFSMLQEQLTQVLDSLADRERKVIELRFGLVDGHPRTLEEVGREFGVTRERIRQIESKTLAKLRHPSRSSKLKDYIES